MFSRKFVDIIFLVWCCMFHRFRSEKKSSGRAAVVLAYVEILAGVVVVGLGIMHLYYSI